MVTVSKCFPYIVHEVRRFHGGRGAQMLQDEVIGLLQPKVHAAQRIVVERTDTKHAHTVVVDVQYLEYNE